MAEYRDITCEDCGSLYATTKGNTKFCGRCRLIRNFNYSKDSTISCWACKAKYSPIERNDTACADCTYQPVNPGTATCVMCGEDRLRVKRGLDVCHWCARDTAKRPALFQGLLQTQRKLQAERAA